GVIALRQACAPGAVVAGLRRPGHAAVVAGCAGGGIDGAAGLQHARRIGVDQGETFFGNGANAVGDGFGALAVGAGAGGGGTGHERDE
ncbi:hypothetical protein LTR94_035522, partial [Friedmanniomyces endolithicus]